MERRRGAVLADSVGLGKTYVALALVEETLAAGQDAAIVVPAVLRRTWRRLVRRVERAALAGCVEGAAGRCHVVSHAQLSRGSHRPERLAGCGLVVVDEAHRFRNPATRRYAALAELCRSARVLLITATPVNNGPEDLLHLLRLFAPDDAFRDLGMASLMDAFEEALPPRPASFPPGIGRVIQEVVIRRTRADVEGSMTPGSGPSPSMTGAVPRFPRCADPAVLWTVAAADADEIVEAVCSLELPGYGAADPRGPTVAALVRLGLLKRLDSSRAALRASVQRHAAFARSFVEAARAGRLLRIRDHRAVTDTSDGDQLAIVEVVAEAAPPGVDLDGLARAASRDLRRLQRIARLAALADPKVDALVELLGRIAAEKAVVFTEYRATAAALWSSIATRFRAGRVDGSGAWLGARPAGRRAVVERFAPSSNGARDPPDRERVDVLVATDVLAEGLNLQDARHVVSYDLPWNPVRLLQRIGRVDRLGSPHEQVYPYLFAPGPGLDAALRLTARLRSKLGAIEDSVGAEGAAHLLERLGGPTVGPGAVLRTLDSEGGSPTEALRATWLRAAARAAGDAARPRSPVWGRIAGVEAATSAPAAEPVLVLARLGDRPWILEVRGESVGEPGADAVAAVRAAIEGRDSTAPGDAGKGREASSWAATHPGASRTAAIPPRVLQAVRRAERHLADGAAAGSTPAGIRPRSVAGRVATRLRRALDTPGAVPSGDLLVRADRVLARLGRPPGPATEAALRRLVEEPRPGSTVAVLLDRIEAALENDPRPVPGPPPPAPEPHILAALLVEEPRASRG